jgi:hypothetical protein
MTSAIAQNLANCHKTKAELQFAVPLPQLFNRVIHRFRGYPESVWLLNRLTAE